MTTLQSLQLIASGIAFATAVTVFVIVKANAAMWSERR